MKIKPTIRRTLLATLMAFVTAAIGLQPLVFSAGSGCTCDAMASVDADAPADESSCCHSSVEELHSDGSASKANPNPCCCNPEALACDCGGCGCSEDHAPRAPVPAIPSNETSEVVAPVLICAAPLIGFPRASEIKRAAVLKTVADHAILSSQQTCVFLSRFTC